MATNLTLEERMALDDLTYLGEFLGWGLGPYSNRQKSILKEIVENAKSRYDGIMLNETIARTHMPKSPVAELCEEWGPLYSGFAHVTFDGQIKQPPNLKGDWAFLLPDEADEPVIVGK